jgi:hypothetical protein
MTYAGQKSPEKFEFSPHISDWDWFQRLTIERVLG